MRIEPESQDYVVLSYLLNKNHTFCVRNLSLMPALEELGFSGKFDPSFCVLESGI